MCSYMKKETLKKLIESYRDSIKASDKMKEALELYSDDYVSFSDQALTGFTRFLVEDEYWENAMETIYYYLTNWCCLVPDYDKWKDWEVLMWWLEKHPYKVKEVITDDDRFISYFYDTYEN